MDVDMDSLSKLEEMLKTVDGDKTPSRKELLDMLEQSEMEEEMKENLRAMLSGNVPQLFGSYGSGTYLGILFVLIIFGVLCKCSFYGDWLLG
ncbi:hypothetical protein RR46_12624 [Papilio xuthus]|uniref:Uncharacterized protein n=1 Tax=Papilio xuthus TaxID=66420 RepID=A0A194PV12_PAPXU|nr:hypothetical protein RR46_12624 [Papilio xuthus]